MADIKLTKAEAKAVREAWALLERTVDKAHNEGASASLERLMRDAERLAKADAPEGAPRVQSARAHILHSVAQGLDNPTRHVGYIATCTHWHYLAYGLGAALEVHIWGSADGRPSDAIWSLIRAFRAGHAAYVAARTRYLDSLYTGGAS